jgi:hypothetical protein
MSEKDKLVKYIQQTNLDRINMQKIAEGVINAIEECQSTSLPGKFFDKMHLKSNNERLELINNLIRKARDANNQITNFKAELFLSEQTLEKMLFYTPQIAEAEFKLKLAQLDTQIMSHKTAQFQAQLNYDNLAADILKKKAEVKMLEAESAFRYAQTDAEKAKNQRLLEEAKLISFVVNNLNIKDMPQSLQSYVISSIVNPRGDQFQDFDMHEQLKEFVKQEASAKAKKADADAEYRTEEARARRVQTNLEEWDTKEQMKPK